MSGESTLQLHEGNAVNESIKSYEYDIIRLLAPSVTVPGKLQ